MSKYIKADELIEKYLDEENYFPTDDYFEGYIDGIIFCHRMVDDMPSADVVEVVRCEDCEHADVGEKDVWCESYESYKEKDGFCDDGKRRETE